MPFSLKPNPGLYAKMAKQWEADEQQRLREEVHLRHWMCMEHYHFFMLFLVLLAMSQVIIILYRRRVVRRREAGRRMHFRAGRDVEDVTVGWRDDAKVSYADDDDERR